MSYGQLDFIADQLRASNPSADWNAAGVDRAYELAAIFQRNGIIDLSQLQLAKVKFDERPFEWSDPAIVDEYCLIYGGKTFGYLGQPDTTSDAQSFLKSNPGGYLIAWSAVGHGNVNYFVIGAASGFTIAPTWASSSDWGAFHDLVRGAVLVCSFALPVAGIAVGEIVGTAIVSAEFAAAYPVATAAIGNIAVATVMSGGNVKAAVESIALSYLGQTVGNYAAAASEAKTVGIAANAATKALITGKDIASSVRDALLMSGIAHIGDVGSLFQSSDIQPDTPLYTPTIPDPAPIPIPDVVIADQTAPVPDVSSAIENYSAQLAPQPKIPAPSEKAQMDMIDTGDPYNTGYDSPSFATGPDGVLFNSGSINTIESGALANPILTDQGGSIPLIGSIDANVPLQDLPTLFQIDPLASPVAGGVSTTPPDQGGTSTGNIVNTLTAAALAALKIYNQIKTPVQAQSQSQSGGVTHTARSDGLIQTQVGAQVSLTKPPVNQPQATIDGSIINNNGDGTYTVIAANGASATRQYPATVPTGGAVVAGFNLSDPRTQLMLGGIGIVALLLMRRRG